MRENGVGGKGREGKEREVMGKRGARVESMNE